MHKQLYSLKNFRGISVVSSRGVQTLHTQDKLGEIKQMMRPTARPRSIHSARLAICIDKRLWQRRNWKEGRADQPGDLLVCVRTAGWLFRTAPAVEESLLWCSHFGFARHRFRVVSLFYSLSFENTPILKIPQQCFLCGWSPSHAYGLSLCPSSTIWTFLPRWLFAKQMIHVHSTYTNCWQKPLLFRVCVLKNGAAAQTLSHGHLKRKFCAMRGIKEGRLKSIQTSVRRHVF